MTISKAIITENQNQGVSIATSAKKQLINISGILTSPLQLGGENTSEPYYYSFIRLKGQSIDLPVIFKIKDNQEAKLMGQLDFTKRQCYICLDELLSQEKIWCNPCKEKILSKNKKTIEPKLKKGQELELAGHYSNSPNSIRKSFTCLTYQLLDQDKKIKKECSGCGDNFFCLNSENYDYCKKCELNGSRYVNQKSNCSECDGSGMIKFAKQPLRNCKLCSLKSKENILSHE